MLAGFSVKQWFSMGWVVLSSREPYDIYGTLLVVKMTGWRRKKSMSLSFCHLLGVRDTRHPSMLWTVVQYKKLSHVPLYFLPLNCFIINFKIRFESLIPFSLWEGQSFYVYKISKHQINIGRFILCSAQNFMKNNIAPKKLWYSPIFSHLLTGPS